MGLNGFPNNNMSLQPIKFGMENTVDPNWTAQPIPFRQPNLSQSSANLSHANETWLNTKVDQQQAEKDAAQAKQSADEANSASGLTKETVKGSINTLVTPAAKFIKSAVATPIDMVRSLFGKKPIDLGGVDANGNPITTIQQDADTATQDVMAGDKSPIQATAELTGSTVAGAADVLGAGEGLSRAAGIVDPLLGKITREGVDLTAGKKFLSDSVSDTKNIGKDIQNPFKKDALKQTIKDVSPRLTPKEAESVSTKTSRFTKKISVVPEQSTLDTATKVNKYIKSGKTFSEKATLADKGISAEAESLKAQIKGVDHPVPKRELISALSKTERPVLIASDRTMNTAFTNVLKKATEIINKMDGTISGTLDGRKAFDEFVSKQFPNLYESDTMTPMRTAIKDLRSTWNDFTEAQLPDDVKFKDSLDTQSKLFDARDTLREKAARGAPTRQGEIGTNRFQRYAEAHPKTTKALKYVGGVAATSVGVGEVVKHSP